MTYTTLDDKKRVAEWLPKYQGAGNVLSAKTVSRLLLWLDRYTYGEIAKREGITAQAVAYSVNQACKAILEFAKANDKH